MVKFYFGDPCYCMDDTLYQKEWGVKLNFNDTIVWPEKTNGILNKNNFLVSGTSHGDGRYYAAVEYLFDIKTNEVKHLKKTTRNKAFCVDSGTLALVREDLWGKSTESCKEDGMVIELDGKGEDYFLELIDGTHKSFIIKRIENGEIVFKINLK